MGVERERSTRPRPRVVTEALFDLGAMEELRAVLRAEAQGELRVVQCLAAAAVPEERPREHVVTVDRRPLSLRTPGQRERVPQPDAVVDVEEGGLEIDADAVGDEEPPDPVLGRVLDARRARMAGRREQVAQQADELRQRDRVDGALLEALSPF